MQLNKETKSLSLSISFSLYIYIKMEVSKIRDSWLITDSFSFRMNNSGYVTWYGVYKMLSPWVGIYIFVGWVWLQGI